MSKKQRRVGNGKSMIQKLNFWLVTLGVVIAGFMTAECLIWYRGGL